MQDTTSAVGGGLSGLVFNTAGLVAEYRRQGQNAWSAITLVTATLGTFTSGGFIADGSLAGAYELGVPDAALAAGARWAAVRLYGAANMLPVLIEIELDAVNYQDGAGFGLSRLDAAISSRSTYAGGAVASVTADVGITQAGADKVWASAARTLTSFGTLVADAAAAVWAAVARTLTAGTNIVLAKGVGVTGLNDLDATGAQGAAAAALTAFGAATQANVTAVGAAVNAVPGAITADHGAGSYVDTGGGTAPSAAAIEAALAAVHGTGMWDATLSAVQAAQVAAGLSGSALLIHRGDSWSATLTGLGDLTGRLKLWFTGKRRAQDADSAALVQITEAGGLAVLAGEAPPVAGTGTLTVDNAATGQVTIRLSAAATAELPQLLAGLYDLQVEAADGSIRTLTQAVLTVELDVTEAIS